MNNKERLWKAIEAYRSSGGMEEHWARRDHLDAEIDTWVDKVDALTAELGDLPEAQADLLHKCKVLAAERDKLKAAAQAGLDALEDVFGKGKIDVGAITQLRDALKETTCP